MIILGVAFSVACGSGDDSDADETPAPDDAQAIRNVDVTKLAEVQNALRQLNSGAIAKDEVLFKDVTGDRREEAVVPITSQGTLGNLAYLVYTLKSGTPSLILTRGLSGGNAGGLAVEVEDGTLVETTPEFGPEDPFCCPSFVNRTTFRWDGSKLQVAKEEKIKGASQKD